MEVLRVRFSGFVIFVAALLAGCTGSTESANDIEPKPISLSGSVGDGPVVGADVVVTDAAGAVLEQRTSDGTASYQLTLAADTALPVRLEASGGTDLVTGRALDFTLAGAALESGTLTVNLSPLTTLAVRAAQCSADGLTAATLDAAWERVYGQLSMGLDQELVADPMGEPVTRSNIEAVVLANEAVGETVRRTIQALANAGFASDGDRIVEAVACDLMGRADTAAGEPVDPRAVATFKSAELAVRLETLAGRLEVDGQSAVSRMNEAIRTVMAGFSNPDVAAVPVTPSGRDQALASLAVFQAALASDELVELAAALDGAPVDTVADRVNAALTASLQGDLRAFADNMAFADEAAVTELAQRRAAREAAARPAVSLAAQPTSLAAGESSQLSWATSDADRCVAAGAWSGARDLEGATSTGALQQSAVYELICAGLGGTTQRSVMISVDGSPEPDPAPAVSLSAASSTVTSGGATELTWTASDAQSCSASGGWSGDRAASGSETVGPLTAATTFSLTCTGAGGSDSAAVTINVEAAPAQPTLSLSARDSSVTAGQSTQLDWNSSDATSCSASGGWSGSRSVDGSATVGPINQDTTYTLSCSGAGGSVQRSVTVTAEAAPEQPTLSLSAQDSSVTEGESTQLSWNSSNATSCSASGGWSGSRSVDGSATVGPINQDTTYTLSCSGAGGSVQRSVTVTAEASAPEPTVDLQAADLVVNQGGSTQLSWSSTDADGCSASGGWSGSRATSGTESVGPLSQQTSFTLTCSGSGGNAVSMISVAVNGTVALSWQAPTENTDGSPLTDLSEYRVYVGETSRDYDQSFDVPAGASSYDLTLASGEYYLAMTAIDADGNESAYSNEIVRTVD